MATVNSYTGDMPAPDRTSLPEIVTAASALLEERGLDGVTMQAVAERVGVRAPSLYKRVAGREALLRLVAERAFADLAERLDAARDLPELAAVYRAYGHARPAAFRLIVSPGVGVPTVDVSHAAAASAAVRRLVRERLGVSGVRELEAARTVTAWATGFIGMELHSGFNLGGDLDAAWDFGLSLVLGGLDVVAGAGETSPQARGSSVREKN